MVKSVSNRCVALQEKVIIRIKNQQDGGEDVFRRGIHVHLKKLMLVYCQKRDFDYKTSRFIYNGILLKPRQTPAQLTMKDHQVIHVLTEPATVRS